MNNIECDMSMMLTNDLPQLCFFFNDTATTEIYTLSLHDALPILWHGRAAMRISVSSWQTTDQDVERSEEHTSELQSRLHLVCRLLLEKKKEQENVYSPRFITSSLVRHPCCGRAPCPIVCESSY